MSLVTVPSQNWKIGTGAPLAVIAGLNVLEDLDLALTVGRELKAICERLGLPYIFKASFDKANRSSITSYRGPGFEKGVPMMAEIKQELGVGVCTDLHEPFQAEAVAKVADIVQIPAFLCRQTDLVVATAKAAADAGSVIQVKKAQFLAPWDTKNIVSKIGEVLPGIQQMQALGCPVTIDATHAVQLPGADPRTAGASTGGRREGVSIIAKSAIAAGADGIFLEFHTDPDKALCDGPSCLPLTAAEPLLKELKAIHEIVN